MKICRFFVTSLALVLTTFSHAQKLRKLYYNDQWELTIKDSAKYYRTCSLDTIKYQFVGEVKDFTMGGQLLMSGFYQQVETSESLTLLYEKSGVFTSYYPSGQIESQGEFKNNVRSGTWKYFHPDGKPFREIRFTKDDFFVISLYDQKGEMLIQDGTGKWQFIYAWYEQPKKFEVRGNFLEGEKVGEWTCGFVNGEPLYQEFFKNGEFKGGYLLNADGGRKEKTKEEFQNKFMLPYKYEVTEKFLYRAELTRNDYPFFTFLRKPYIAPVDVAIDSLDRRVFLVVEQPPEYEGGMDAMYKFIAQNMRYPVEARRMNIQGSVFVGFIVEADGSIKEASIIKGIGGGCDEEALRVVLMMPKWRPGTQSGKFVRVKFVLPVKFRQEIYKKK